MTVSDVDTSYCSHCGHTVHGHDHRACRTKLALEPPRFCAACDRRMKVQVTPTGWTAECVEHGTLAG